MTLTDLTISVWRSRVEVGEENMTGWRAAEAWGVQGQAGRGTQRRSRLGKWQGAGHGFRLQ